MYFLYSAVKATPAQHPAQEGVKTRPRITQVPLLCYNIHDIIIKRAIKILAYAVAVSLLKSVIKSLQAPRLQMGVADKNLFSASRKALQK